MVTTRSYVIPWPVNTPGGPNPHWVKFFRDRTETRYRKEDDLYWDARRRAVEPYPPFRNLPFADPSSDGRWRKRGTITSKAYKWGALWKRWLIRVRVRLNEVTYAPGGPGALLAKRSFQDTPRNYRAVKRSRR
jgi:hypothetical protein